MSDREADYGLAEGERFEPSPLDDEFDLSQLQVMTLLGPVDPGALGLTIFVANAAEFVAASEIDPFALLAEFEVAHTIGLRSLVIDDPALLLHQREHFVWLAERSPVHLILLTDQQLGHDGRRFSWNCVDENEPEQTVDAERYCIVTEQTVAGFSEHLSTGHSAVSRILGGVYWPPISSNVDVLSNFLHSMPLAMMELGFSAMDVRTILVDNPVATLSWTRTNSG